jgi:hypothetical protein
LSLNFILGVKIYTFDTEDRVRYWRDEYNDFSYQLEEQRSWKKDTGIERERERERVRER